MDAEGDPTTDPKAALGGTLLPIGGAKGGALALMIEILAAAVTGSAFGWEASSFFDDQGGPPNMGHVLIALDAGGCRPAPTTSAWRRCSRPSPPSRTPACPARAASRTARARPRTASSFPAALHAEIRALVERPA